MDVSLIRFTVLRHDEHAAKFHKIASQVEFKLGLGPCGRYVDHLESQIDYHGVTITQTSYPEDWLMSQRPLRPCSTTGARWIG